MLTGDYRDCLYQEVQPHNGEAEWRSMFSRQYPDFVIRPLRRRACHQLVKLAKEREEKPQPMTRHRYALRDDQWERMKNGLPGREGTVGVTAKDI